MSNGERRLVYVLLIGIIALSALLIFKIKSKPKYNQELYEQVYSEYKNMLKSIDENKEVIIKNESDKVKADTIYINVNSKGQEYRVAGEISIPKIKINYPIIYETSEEYLKIAPTKLFGPEVNEIGNLCIVGHNYKNNEFFSRLSELEIDDRVYLTSNNGKKLTYLVYDKYEIYETDLECTNQYTNGNIEITLITCTSKKKKRLIVKCRAVNYNNSY